MIHLNETTDACNDNKESRVLNTCLCLEAALYLACKKTSSDNRLRLSNAEKIVCIALITNDAMNLDSFPSTLHSRLEKLDNHKLWITYLCYVAPSLYRLIKDDDNKDDSVMLELHIPTTGTRMELLRKCYNANKSEILEIEQLSKILSLMHEYSSKKILTKTKPHQPRKFKTNVQELIGLTSKVEKDLNALSKDSSQVFALNEQSTTLEQRVRARAADRKRRQSEMTSSSTTREQPVASHCLPMADAIWSYLRAKYKRHGFISFSLDSSVARPAPIIMSATASELVEALEGTTGTGLSIITTHRQGQKFQAQRQIFSNLAVLLKTCPKWLTTPTSETEFSKSTIIRVSSDPNLYVQTRHLLGAPKSRTLILPNASSVNRIQKT